MGLVPSCWRPSPRSCCRVLERLAQKASRAAEPIAQLSVEVVEVDGRRQVRPWKPTGKAQRILDQAEVLFKRKRYGEAKRIAEQALKVDPGYYITWLYLGDCEHFAGNPAAALELYRKAAELNPADSRVHFFQASAQVRLGDLAAARKGLAKALALHPRRPAILERTRKDARLDFTVADFFLPRVQLTKKSDQEISLRVEPDAPHWLGYGLCKAAWIMEPEHRGTPQHRFTSREERECLGVVVDAYQASREAKQVSEDEGLEILSRVASEGQLDFFVLYELASRVAPQITLRLTEPELEELAGFIDRYLFVPR